MNSAQRHGSTPATPAQTQAIVYAIWPDIYDFGERVSPVSDLDGDDIPELRIRGYSEVEPGVEQEHTFIVSGVDGFPLYEIIGYDPFDPWATQPGDVDGDGDVDQLDLDLIWENRGITEGATVYDGDVDGDGDVDTDDWNFAVGLFGSNIFEPMENTGDPMLGGPGGTEPDPWDCPAEIPPGWHCVENCWGHVMILPIGVEPLCEPVVCQAWCGFDLIDHSADILPIDSYDDVYVVEAVNGLSLDEVQWGMDGEELVEVTTNVGDTFTFEPRLPGFVQVQATHSICGYTCQESTLEVYLDFLDSDYDSLPDAWENLWGLDPNDPSDAYIDNDNDGLINLYEYAYQTNPFVVDAPGDTDGDGIPDPCEITLGYDENDPMNPPDPLIDSDNDGVVDAYEVCIFGTDPAQDDTDDDGLPDGWEIFYGMQPLDDLDAGEDADGDGIDNLLEYLYGTSPINAFSVPGPDQDADQDGYIDWLEDVYGTDPQNASSVPDVEFAVDDVAAAVIFGEGLAEAPETIISMCVGDCFKLHGTGTADSWEILQGDELIEEVVEDNDNSCYSGEYCITGEGTIVIGQSTPSVSGGPPTIGAIEIQAEDCDEEDEECELKIETGGEEPPEVVCVGDQIALTASIDPPPGGGDCDCEGEYQWTVLEFASFVGGNTGPTVTLEIDEPGEISVGVNKGECSDEHTLTAIEVDLQIADVSEQDEESPGYWMPISDPATPRELLPTVCLKLHPSDLDEQVVNLEWVEGGDNLRLWRRFGESGFYTWEEIIPPVDIDLATFNPDEAPVLHIEATSPGTSLLEMSKSDCIDHVRINVKSAGRGMAISFIIADGTWPGQRPAGLEERLGYPAGATVSDDQIIFDMVLHIPGAIVSALNTAFGTPISVPDAGLLNNATDEDKQYLTLAMLKRSGNSLPATEIWSSAAVILSNDFRLLNEFEAHARVNSGNMFNEDPSILRLIHEFGPTPLSLQSVELYTAFGGPYTLTFNVIIGGNQAGEDNGMVEGNFAGSDYISHRNSGKIGPLLAPYEQALASKQPPPFWTYLIFSCNGTMSWMTLTGEGGETPEHRWPSVYIYQWDQQDEKYVLFDQQFQNSNPFEWIDLYGTPWPE